MSHKDSHLDTIYDRYKDRENIVIKHTSSSVIIDRYLSKVIDVEEFRGKTILEIGAGGSQYARVFLDHGCAKYYANDLIPERLTANKIEDSRYIELPGDFLKIDIPEKVDIIFCSLTMMLVIPMLDKFAAKISDNLVKDGFFFSMEANHFCPLSIYRVFTVKGANPVKFFSPMKYAKTFEKKGLETIKLVPFTAPVPMVTGSWLLGTAFWYKGMKK